MFQVNQLTGFGHTVSRKALSYLQSAVDGTNASTYTFSSENLGDAEKSRRIIVGIVMGNSAADISISSVTIGGVTATLLDGTFVNEAGARAGSYLYIAKVPNGATGDIVVTFSGTQDRCGIMLWRMTGFDDTPFDNTNDGSITASSVDLSINTKAGGCAVGIVNSLDQASSTWVGLNEDDDGIDIETSRYMTGASLQPSSAATPLTITCTPASTPFRITGASASFG